LVRSAKIPTSQGLVWIQRHYSVCRIWCADGSVTSASGAAGALGVFGATRVFGMFGSTMSMMTRAFSSSSCHKKGYFIFYYIYSKYIIS
jgi:hypothetical protein